MLISLAGSKELTEKYGYCELRLQRTPKRKGKPATLAAFHGITAIKTAEQEIINQNKELIQKIINLRKAKNELKIFNPTVSHDLCNLYTLKNVLRERIIRSYKVMLYDRFSHQMGIV